MAAFSSASKISVFSKDIEFSETKIPEPSQDFVHKFKESSGARKDYSGQHVINVLPNFVPILAYILYHVNQYTPHLEHTKHAKISAGTFTAYCLALVYGYILCCDLYVRPTPSIHATAWEDDTIRQRFVEFLFTLPVPDFIAPILNKLTPTTSEHRGNVYYIPSAAGFTYTSHFGRFFPLIMFTNLHDISAETAANTSPPDVFGAYLSRTLYTLTSFVDENTDFDASPAHFLGTYFQSNAHPASYASRLEQLFQSVFNPVLFRDYQRRQTLSSISLAHITYPDQHMNFYDLVFSASNTNLSELRTVFQSISGAMKGNVKCPGDLASFFKTFSGQDILRHGYSHYALPTWHHTPITFPEDSFPKIRRVTPDTFSTVIHFLRTPETPALTTMTQPSAKCQTDETHATTVTFTSVLNRLQPSNSSPTRPAPSTEFVTFNENQHLFPKVYVFNLSGSTVDAWDATAFGMIIESFDIDGTVLPMPNTELNLGIENTWFADSSIPLRYCYKSTDHTTTPGAPPARALKRVRAPRQTRFPAASLLVDRTSVVLPKFNAQSVSPGSTPNSWFPGLTPLSSVNWPEFIQRFLGFRTVDARSHSETDDDIPGMTRKLLAWSPYTYVGYEGENEFVPDHSESRIYFITNLRSIFGTDIPMIEVTHPLDAMPVY